MTQQIPLSRGLFATVDDGDFDLFTGRRWHAAVGGGDGHTYAMGYRPGAGRGSTLERMHRVIMGAVPGQVVDHINGDTLDNRRSNLRICTLAENARNTRRHRDNKSGFKGVYFNTSRGRWQASICVDGKKRSLGRYDTAEQAAAAYDDAAAKAFGGFAVLNFSKDIAA